MNQNITVYTLSILILKQKAHLKELDDYAKKKIRIGFWHSCIRPITATFAIFKREITENGVNILFKSFNKNEIKIPYIN